MLKPDDKGKYMIIAGERRYRASKLARKSDIPAVIKRYTYERYNGNSTYRKLTKRRVKPDRRSISL